MLNNYYVAELVVRDTEGKAVSISASTERQDVHIELEGRQNGPTGFVLGKGQRYTSYPRGNGTESDLGLFQQDFPEIQRVVAIIRGGNDDKTQAQNAIDSDIEFARHLWGDYITKDKAEVEAVRVEYPEARSQFDLLFSALL